MTNILSIEDENELYAQLITRDEVAASKLLLTYYLPLSSLFKKIYKVNSDMMTADIIYDTVLLSLNTLIESPEKFNPFKGRLQMYLKMDIEGDLRNRLRKEKNVGDFVELSDINGNSLKEDNSYALAFKEHLESINSFIGSIFNNEIDQQIALLVVSYERETEIFSEILCIQDQPIDQQRIIVKRHKDRIKNQLNRKGWPAFLERLKDE